MGKSKDDFRKRLLSTFKIEAHEHIKTLSSGLIELEKNPSAEVQTDIVETIYRSSHSLKGAARAVNMTDIETICQSLEGVFAVWKQGRIQRSSVLFTTLHHTIDIIGTLLSSIDTGAVSAEKTQISKLIQDLSLFENVGERKGEVTEAETPHTTTTSTPAASSSREHQFVKKQPHASETVRISTAKLGSLMLQAEEMLNAKLMASHHYTNLHDVVSLLEELKNKCKKMHLDTLPARLSFGKKHHAHEKDVGVTQFLRQQEFVDWTHTHINSIEDKLASLIKSSRQYNKILDRMVNNLLDDMKKAMMLPFSTLLEGFPLLIRNISHEQGKEVDLVIHGEGIEIDRRILEEIKDPLIHLARNCVDHGIEEPSERMKHKKQSRGIINITISHINGSKVEMLVSDDGSGIDAGKIKRTAVKNGIISQAEADTLNEQALLSFIFRSGFSTSPIITDISGRGLGLAIVREIIEKLGGSISIETRLHTGTTFRILLPLTIATFRGVSVRAANRVFIIPSTHVEQAARIKNDEIKTVENKETISLNGRTVPFVRLERALELSPPPKKENSRIFTAVLVLCFAEKRIAFGVDEMLNEQEVLVKGLGKQLSRIRNIAGAAILGTGKPVPILNVSDLIKSAVKASIPVTPPATLARESDVKRKSVLIAEDSITSRILLRNILESAGYTVKTAVDGIDAITLLKTEDFDLVVSDVEMPRMNGFDLTRKIRDDKKLADTPVVLVTALESREDRERGIEVGANAYIVKSSFDQSNLLEVVRRLI